MRTAPEAQAAVAAEAAPPPPLPMTAEEAMRQAEAEGLTLLKADNSSGYKGVSFSSGRSKPYQAHVRRGGRTVSLGFFATAEEAALITARTPEAKAAVAAAAAPQPPPPMTAEQALLQAEAEGLTLLKADNRSGFKGVSFDSGSKRTKPYQAQVQRGGRRVALGCFATAEQAALIIARAFYAEQAAAPLPSAALSRKRKAEPEEELEDAEEEDDVVVVVLDAYEV